MVLDFMREPCMYIVYNLAIWKYETELFIFTLVVVVLL